MAKNWLFAQAKDLQVQARAKGQSQRKPLCSDFGCQRAKQPKDAGDSTHFEDGTTDRLCLSKKDEVSVLHVIIPLKN